MSQKYIQPLRGFHDLLPEQQQRHQHIIRTAQKISRCYGFLPIETPIVERSSVFKRSLGEAADIVNKEMYSFFDRKEEEITLRPEATASVVRAVLSHSLPLPFKCFYCGPMFRYERPQKGRLRQFHQVGVEAIGVKDVSSDRDVIASAYLFLQTLFEVQCAQKASESSNDSPFYLEINSLGDTESRTSYLKALKDYLDSVKTDLSSESQVRLQKNPLRILDSKSKDDQKLLIEAPNIFEFLNSDSQSRFNVLRANLDQMGIAYKVNPLLVRGLDYYSHIVFEFKTDLLGAQDAILSGGHYSHLMKLLGGKDEAGTGWAAGVERLNLLLDVQSFDLSKERVLSIVEIDKTEPVKTFSLKLSEHLRKKGIVVEVFSQGNLSKKMKKVNALKSPFCLLIGEQEVESQKVQCKNMSSGEQEHVSLQEFEKKYLQSFQSG